MFPAFVRGRALDLCLLAALLATSACASGGPGTVPTSIPGPVAEKKPDAVVPRRKRPPRPAADSAALELAVTKRLAHRPLALALTKRTQKPELADRAAFVVVQEAKRLRMSPSLLAAVLLIENARLDSTVVSTQGAIGMMQVMPVHAGSYGCSSSDLLNLEANICHGARLLKTLLRRSGDMQVALRRYNGCVRGRHTPRCHRYPVRVLRTASRLRREILVSAAAIPESASPEMASSKDEAEVGDSISGTESGAESAGCGSFFACLRYKWSAPR